MSKKTDTEEKFIEEAQVAESISEPRLNSNEYNSLTIDAKVKHLQDRCDWLSAELGKVKK